MTKSNNIRSSAYLLMTAIIWGVAFVFQSMGNDHMQAFTFTSSRYLLGFLVLLPIVLIKYFHPRFLADSDEIPIKQVPLKRTALGGVLCVTKSHFSSINQYFRFFLTNATPYLLKFQTKSYFSLVISSHLLSINQYHSDHSIILCPFTSLQTS